MAQSGNSGKGVLVTGATGFVGRNLVDALSRQGERVTCLVRASSDTRLLEQAGVRLVRGDVNDAAAIRQAVSGVRTVYHLAGVIKAARRDQYFRVNREGTRLLLEILAEENPGISRFVHMSSLAAAGPSGPAEGLGEDDTPRPVSWYGESKLESEREAVQFAKTFPVTVLRPSAVYGPHDRETLLAFRMIRRGCLVTPGRSVRRFSLVHVHDLAAACLLAAARDTPSGSVYFIARPEICTWEELGGAIARELGRRCRQIRLPGWTAGAVGLAGDLWASATGRAATLNSQKVRELMQPNWICNPSRALSELGFRPEIDLQRGIRETVRWYREQGWL